MPLALQKDSMFQYPDSTSLVQGWSHVEAKQSVDVRVIASPQRPGCHLSEPTELATIRRGRLRVSERGEDSAYRAGRMSTTLRSRCVRPSLGRLGSLVLHRLDTTRASPPMVRYRGRSPSTALLSTAGSSAEHSAEWTKQDSHKLLWGAGICK